MKNLRKTALTLLSLLLVICQVAVFASCSAPDTSQNGSDGTTNDSPPYSSDDNDLPPYSSDGNDFWDDPGGGFWNDAEEGSSGPEVDGWLSGESYTEITENRFISTSEQSKSYFSIDANSASYPNLRSLISKGLQIPKDAVRVEEMLNYFDYDYDTPSDGAIFSLTSSVFDSPFGDTKLLTVGLATQEIEFDSVQNNLVFLIDTSGSMYSSDKLPLVQEAFNMLLGCLGENDRISIVTYAGHNTVALDGAYGYQKHTISAVINDLSANGSTAGSEGIQKAYEIAQKYFIEGGNNRVILATDGDFNVGITRLEDLSDFISEKRDSGVYFSIFGVGHGNIKSDTMEMLALNGNGTYSYIDSVAEARRALVDGIGGSIITVARDVKAGVVFNPEYIDSYRLIGYENKLMSEDDFNDEHKDAGELGSGHTVTVVYEIRLTDKALSDGGSLASVTVKYKPSENADVTDDHELVLDIGTDAYTSVASASDLFIASVVEFALILRDSEYKQNADLELLIERLDSLDLVGDRAEFRDLVKMYRQKYAP